MILVLGLKVCKKIDIVFEIMMNLFAQKMSKKCFTFQNMWCIIGL